MRKQIKPLKHHPDFQKHRFLLFGVSSVHRFVVLPMQKQFVFDKDLAACDLFQLVKRPKIRGFASAGGADDANHFALFYFQIDIFENLKRH